MEPASRCLPRKPAARSRTPPIWYPSWSNLAPFCRRKMLKFVPPVDLWPHEARNDGQIT